MSSWKEKYIEYYEGDSENLISTKELINRACMLQPGIEGELAKDLIKIKSIRSQTIAIKEQTKAINKNSAESDKLVKVGHYLTCAIIFLGVIQILIAVIK